MVGSLIWIAAPRYLYSKYAVYLPLDRQPASMANPPRRALPAPPGPPPREYLNDYMDREGTPGAFPETYAYGNPYNSPYPYPPFVPHTPIYEEQPSALRGGTLLHKGFYDLLSLIPSTPSPSRLFWRDDSEPIAGPRYEELTSTRDAPIATSTQTAASPMPVSPNRNLRGRRISKDMVSKPTGFVYVRVKYHIDCELICCSNQSLGSCF